MTDKPLVVGLEGVTTGSARIATPEPAAAKAQVVAAARVVAPSAVAATTALAEEAEVTRAEQIAALPEFGKVTGLKAVESGITLHITPLRSGGLAPGYFDESTSVSTILGKTKDVRTIIDAAITAHAKDWDLGQVSLGGRVDLVAMRCSEPFKNARCGVYKLRVLMDLADMVISALGSIAVVTKAFGIEYTHETIIPDEFYPGAVIEQIAEQAGVAASFKRDMEIGKNVFVYQFAVTSAAQSQLIEKRGFLVQLGKHGKFGMREVERKVSFETIYAYGCSGVGSAKEVLKEPIADSLAVPADMVRITGVGGVTSGVGTVVAIKYPYSKANYDAAAQLLDQCQFKLRHATVKSFAIEITLAITPLELGKRLALKLLRDEESSDSEDEEEEALDLRIKEGERYYLEPYRPHVRQDLEGGELEVDSGSILEEVTDFSGSGGGGEDGYDGYGSLVGAMGHRLHRYVHLTSYALEHVVTCLMVLWCLWQQPRGSHRNRGWSWVARGVVTAGNERRGGAEQRVAIVERQRAMEHLLGWGFCVRQQKRRK